MNIKKIFNLFLIGVGLSLGIGLQVAQADTFSMSSNIDFWRLAHPIKDLNSMESEGIGFGASTDPVFRFHTPAANNLISLTYRFYTNDAFCTLGAFALKSYSVCIDSAHADRDYYIDEANLYKISTAAGVTAALVRCMGQITPEFALVGGAGSCSSGTGLCSATSQPFNRQTLVSQGACNSIEKLNQS